MVLFSGGWRCSVQRLALAACFAALLAPAAQGGETDQEKEKQQEKKAATEEGSSGPKPAEGKEGTPELSLKVLGNYFFELPGLDVTHLTPRQMERFFQRVNHEFCTCGGCTKDTVANCYVNDPGCGSVRQQAKKILNEVKAGK